PQSQGQIERLNQTIGRGFTKLLWDNHNQLQRKDWINVIKAFVRTYNSTVHSAHSRTPHQALFGWKMRGVYDTPNTTIYNDDNNIDIDNNSDSNSDNNIDDDVDNDDNDDDDDNNDNDDDDDNNDNDDDDNSNVNN